MQKYITDERTGINYELNTDYYIPCLKLPEQEKRHIGVWGQRHARYLMEHRTTTYLNLLTECKLIDYLADIDKQAEELFFRLVKELSEKENVTEQLKSEDMMMWVGKMNNIKNRAMEIVNNQIIYNEETAIY